MLNNNGIKFRILTRAHNAKNCWLCLDYQNKSRLSEQLIFAAVQEMVKDGLLEMTYNRSFAIHNHRELEDGYQIEEGEEFAAYRLTAAGHSLCDDLFSRFENFLRQRTVIDAAPRDAIETFKQATMPSDQYEEIKEVLRKANP